MMPLFSATKTVVLGLGANRTAVGWVRPVSTAVWWNPAGSVTAFAGAAKTHAASATTQPASFHAAPPTTTSLPPAPGWADENSG